MSKGIGKPIKGKVIKFDLIKPGKALLKLKDGKYLEVHLNVLKVLKSPEYTPDGNPVYAVNTNVNLAVWTAEEISELEEE